MRSWPAPARATVIPSYSCAETATKTPGAKRNAWAAPSRRERYKIRHKTKGATPTSSIQPHRNRTARRLNRAIACRFASRSAVRRLAAPGQPLQPRRPPANAAGAPPAGLGRATHALPWAPMQEKTIIGLARTEQQQGPVYFFAARRSIRAMRLDQSPFPSRHPWLLASRQSRRASA